MKCIYFFIGLFGLCQAVEEVPIGISVWDSYSDVFKTMKYALEKHTNDTEKLFQFNVYADRIRTVDAYKLTKIVCRQFDRGIYALVGTVDPESLEILHSFANAYEMPLVTPWFPESIYHNAKDLSKQQHFTIEIRPDYHEALTDLITYYGWTRIIYIYSDFDGLLRLQRIFRTIPRTPSGEPRFHIEMVKRISSVSEAIDFLHSLEKQNRDSIKHVLLDCSANLAKEIIVQHVRSVHLGRRNYHYMMSGLVLDDYWDKSIVEYGAINITGLRLVKTDSSYARNFLDHWSNLDRSKYQSAGNQGITATGALAYDAVTVLEAGFRNLLQQAPNIFKSGGGRKRGNGKGATCDLSGEDRLGVWDHGKEISNALKAVRIEGLTGTLRFNEMGKRVNYSFDVLEMTSDSQMVKVGTWGDGQRLQLSDVAKDRIQDLNPSRPINNQNKTHYILTSVLEPPFLMYRRPVPGQSQNLYGNARFEGYTKELADHLSKELNLEFEIRPVKDGQYGVSDPNVPGGWTGVIGELVRNEADIAISPLTINAQREQVVDFTVPFMRAGISIMMKRTNVRSKDLFSFLSPLSQEIWTCLIFAYFGVSIVLFLVSRFSPCEWRIEDNLIGTRVRNPFSISNSLWFTMGTFMHQYTSLAPKSVAGRMVGCAWWFFSLIIVSAYTSNMAAFLTVERMLEQPIASVDDLAKQTAIEYGTLLGGSSLEFFKNSRIDVYAKMYEFMQNKPYVMVNSTREGVEYVRDSEGRYAFFLEAALNDYYNGRYPCDTMMVGKNLDYKGYGIATSKSSGLHASVNQALLNLKNRRITQALENHWWRSECPNGDTYVRGDLSLANVVGVFFFLAALLVVAMFIAILEFCFKSNNEAKRAKTSLSDAMKNKARLALGPGREVDSVRFYGDSSAL